MKQTKESQADYNKIATLTLKCLNKGTIKKDTLIKIIQAMETLETFIKREKRNNKPYIEKEMTRMYDKMIQHRDE